MPTKRKIIITLIVVLLVILGAQVAFKAKAVLSCLETSIHSLPINERTKSNIKIAYFDFGEFNGQLSSHHFDGMLKICDSVKIVDSTFYDDVESAVYPFGWDRPLFRVRTSSTLFFITIQNVTVAGEESVTSEMRYFRFLTWSWKISEAILGRA